MELAHPDRPPNAMPPPRLSIVIPAYNESARIEAALSSVLGCVEARAWDADILVVDDGSTDNTPAIVQQWMASNPRLHLIQNPGNRGKGATRSATVSSSPLERSSCSPTPTSPPRSKKPNASSRLLTQGPT